MEELTIFATIFCAYYNFFIKKFIENSYFLQFFKESYRQALKNSV